MKKQLLVAAACLASAAASYGQGFVIFANYNGGSLLQPVRYNANPAVVPAGKADLRVGNTFRAQLLYEIGTVTDQNAFDTGGPLFALSGATPATASFVGTDGNVDPDGYFSFGSVTLPTVTGPNSSAVTFQILVWDTRNNGTTFQNAAVAGKSALFTQAVATGPQPVPDFAGHLFTFRVQNTPEPGTLALAGLGAAGLLLFRRRK